MVKKGVGKVIAWDINKENVEHAKKLFSGK